MAFEVSSRVTQALGKVQKTPALVVLFDGVDMHFGSVPIISWLTLDSGLFLDTGLFLDATGAISNQVTALSFAGGSSSTTTKIDYKIDPDLGVGDAITTMKLAFVNDKKNTILNYIDADEFLGRKVRVKMTPDGPTAIWPSDYTTIFRGIVDEVSFEAGMLALTISHPDQKKRQTIFIQHSTKLASAITNAATDIPVLDTSGFLYAANTPFNDSDLSFERYVRIEDEIIYFGAAISNQLESCVRGAFSTAAVAHDADTEVTSYYILTGNAMDLALKTMLSGAPFINATAIRIESPNYLVFAGDVFDLYGLTPGDLAFLRITPLNGPAYLKITEVVYDELSNESHISVDITFLPELVNEVSPTLLVDFKSKYNCWPTGLEMSPDEVDVLAHEELRDLFLFNADMQFYLKGTIDSAKDFITKQLYQPLAAFAVPKNTQSSVGYTIPPLPDVNVKTLDRTNVKMPEKIKIFRQLGRNFYNSVLYKYDEDELEDEYNAGYFVTSTDSRNQIPIGSKIFTITSNGLRAGNVVVNAADRRLFRYKFAAAQIQGLKTTFGEGFEIDIGDSIYVDGDSLMIPDLAIGSESFGRRLFQIIQKTIDIKTGDVSLVVLDTNFNESARYGYISPASTITGVVGSGAGELNFDLAEYAKWSGFVGAAVNVRNADFTIESTGIIKSVSEALSTVPHVTRSTTGTYHNAAGIMKTAGIDVVRVDYDPANVRTNLLLHGSDFTNAAWQFGGTANYTRTANATTSPTGTLTVDSLVVTSGFSSFSSSCPFQILTKLPSVITYTESVYVKDNGAGGCRFRVFFDAPAANMCTVLVNLQTGAIISTTSIGTITGGTSTITALADGWFRVTMTVTSDRSTVLRRQIFAASNSGGTFTGDGLRGIYLWGAQCEVAAAVTNYIDTTTAPDTATSSVATPFLEGEATNLFLRSEDFTHADWQVGGTVDYTRTANAIEAPDGTVTADLMVPNVGISSFNTSCPTQTLTKAASVIPYTTSVYVKDRGAGGVRMRTYFGVSATDSHSMNIDLRTGVISGLFSSGAVSGATAVVQKLPNEWFRISLTGDSTSSTIVRTQIHAYDEAALTYVGDGARGIYLWGAQLEAQGTSTTYIPTTTVAVTRAADVLTDEARMGKVVLVDDLDIIPTEGMIMEFANYDEQVLPLVKLLYTHITDGENNFPADGGAPYYMI